MTAFVERLLTLLCSCEERRFGQWENTSWWDFIQAGQRSPQFQKFLANGMTRTLVAAKASEMSARTGGLVLCQLMFDLVRADGRLDRVLDGPTSAVWIDPWIEHLDDLGVTAETRLPGQRNRLRWKTHHRDIHVGQRQRRADRGRPLRGRDAEGAPAGVGHPALEACEPRLAGLARLHTDWMNGAMFYLHVDKPLIHGHAIFIDSEWSLTAISQAQFWRGFDWTKHGDGGVEGILSVDISEWERKGGKIRKIAKECSKEEIREEVWAQLTAHLDDGSLTKANVLDFFLDPAIKLPVPPSIVTAENDEPLLINTKGSWADRPDAVTAIPNLFLAADFVRTYTDLATMEGANEAARRAVNGILDATGSTASCCPRGRCASRGHWSRSAESTRCGGAWAWVRSRRRSRLIWAVCPGRPASSRADCSQCCANSAEALANSAPCGWTGGRCPQRPDIACDIGIFTPGDAAYEQRRRRPRLGWFEIPGPEARGPGNLVHPLRVHGFRVQGHTDGEMPCALPEPAEDGPDELRLAGYRPADPSHGGRPSLHDGQHAFGLGGDDVVDALEVGFDLLEPIRGKVDHGDAEVVADCAFKLAIMCCSIVARPLCWARKATSHGRVSASLSYRSGWKNAFSASKYRLAKQTSSCSTHCASRNLPCLAASCTATVPRPYRTAK